MLLCNATKYKNKNTCSHTTSLLPPLNIFQISLPMHKHTGSVQEFTAPSTTSYKCECWGAQGGTVSSSNTSTSNIGGKGAYTLGVISLSSDISLYIYVGQCGSITKGLTTSGGGWNGGGNGDASENDGKTRSGGGGSTDIRITSGKLECLGIIKISYNGSWCWWWRWW